jgi:hypothetical protein
MMQFNNLKMEELHRFMRIQFAGEQGIDAGGLEREWFQIGTVESTIIQYINTHTHKALFLYIYYLSYP